MDKTGECLKEARRFFRATVFGFEGKKVIVQKNNIADASCFGCMSAECKQKTILIAAKNPKNLLLEKGQIVEVGSNPSSIAAQSIPALLVPLLGFIAGFLIIKLVFPGLNEGAAAASGVLLMFIAALGFLRFRSHFPADEFHYINQQI
ncbi:MAG: SoxR reducing system RseC family protein [Treponema sp.]|nr:SoxR reducing system RseC family protein [Treponema sp.]